MSAEEKIATLVAEIEAANARIIAVEQRLEAVKEELAADISDQNRVDLVEERKQLNAKELLLRAEKHELLKHKTIALEDQQRGAEPVLFFKKWG